ncbi:MAG: TatD family hydrolase [Saprospiraceae bacterium]|nr:TatD family hydrolase [Saprospiraceae bacterium]
MVLIDTHTHIYLDDFKEDQSEMIHRAKQENISALLMPNIDLTSVNDLISLASSYPDYCFPMMGLHPCSVSENFRSELDTIYNYLSQGNWIGIGEIGLDLYWNKTSFSDQLDSFKIQLEWSKALRLPVSIHSREATEESLQLIEELQDGTLSGVFHCFSGTLEQAKRVCHAGFKLGIGGVVTYKKSTLPEIISSVGPHYLVLETDAPYLSPVPFRGKRNEPSYLKFVAMQISEILSMPIEEIGQITSQNARTTFNLNTIS